MHEKKTKFIETIINYKIIQQNFDACQTFAAKKFCRTGKMRASVWIDYMTFK